MFSGADRAHDCVRGITQFDASGFHHIERKCGLACVENGVATFEMDVFERLRVARLKECDVAREKEVERPVDHHAQLPLDAGQLRQVDRAPHPPRDEAGEFQAHDFRNRGLMTDGGERAEALESERCQVVAARQREREIFSQRGTLPHRELPCRRTSSAAHFRHHRAISSGPQSRLAHDSQRRLRHEPALFIRESGLCTKLRDERVRRVSDGRDDGVTRDHASVAERYLAGRHRGHARAEDDLHAPRAQLFLAINAQVFADLRQQVLATLNEHDAEFFACDPRIQLAHAVREIEQLPRRFHARISAPHDHEREQARERSGVGDQVCLFKTIEQRAAQLHGIAHIFHEKGVLRHPRHAAEIHDAAERQREVPVADLHVWSECARAEFESARGEVDGFDFRAQDRHAAAQSTQGVHDVPGRKRRARDLRQHRLEEHVVLIRDQRHALLASMPQRFGEGLRAIDSGKSAARDYDIKVQEREGGNHPYFVDGSAARDTQKLPASRRHKYSGPHLSPCIPEIIRDALVSAEFVRPCPSLLPITRTPPRPQNRNQASPSGKQSWQSSSKPRPAAPSGSS